MYFVYCHVSAPKEAKEERIGTKVQSSEVIALNAFIVFTFIAIIIKA